MWTLSIIRYLRLGSWLIVTALLFLGSPSAKAQLRPPETANAAISFTIEADGFLLTFTRADLWHQMPNGRKPREDYFLALLGNLKSRDGREYCLYRSDFQLAAGNMEYDISGQIGTLSDLYGLDYPGRIFGHCAEDSQTVYTYILFDVNPSQDELSIIFSDRRYPLTLSITELLDKSATPVPTPTPTNTSTSTPTPTNTPTYTPAPVIISTTADNSDLAPLPLAGKNSTLVAGQVSNDGLEFALQRVDFWDVLPDGSKVPQNVFVALLGTLRQTDDSAERSQCIKTGGFELEVGDKKFEMSDHSDGVEDFYDIYYPGWFVGHCVDTDEVDATFFIFEVPLSILDDARPHLRFRDALLELGGSLAHLRQAGTVATPTPTATWTSTATPTPTATYTYTPAPIKQSNINRSSDELSLIPPASLSSDVLNAQGQVSNKGLQFDLVRIDLWDELPEGSLPENDLFLVMVGVLSPVSDGTNSHCIGADDVWIEANGVTYEMAPKLRAVNRFYDTEFPGFILEQCLPSGRSEPTFFVFDVHQSAGPITLSFHNAPLRFDSGTERLRVASARPTTTPTLTPTATRTPTATPTWTNTPTATAIATLTVASSPQVIQEENSGLVTSTVAQGQRQEARVLSITDGDTIDVEIDGKQFAVRYILMDSPERGAAFSQEATDANRRLVSGQIVYLERDVNDTDRFDRLLRYVYLTDGTFVNAELVRQGYAFFKRYPPDISRETEIALAQQEAIDNSRGLWTNTDSQPAASTTSNSNPTSAGNSLVNSGTSNGEPVSSQPVSPANNVGTINRNANIRSGPGTEYPVAVGSSLGQQVTVIGKNQAGDWYQLDSGNWIAVFLVDNVSATLPVITDVPALSEQPAQPSAPTESQPAPAAPQGQANVIIYIVENYSTFEIIGVKNTGGGPADVGGWYLYGSKGNDSCTIPGGTVLQPGETYQIATGDSQPSGPGQKCGDKPIWNNNGEVIALLKPGGEVVYQIQ